MSSPQESPQKSLQESSQESQIYQHPGEAFLSRYGRVQREEDVFQYVEFLRQETGLRDRPPIDLGVIYRHFGIPTPIRAPLDEQQGILVDSRTGIILIKEDDPIVRQRFTEGHELLELLFDAQEQTQHTSYLPVWTPAHKERLCDRGAADLLMPRSSFVPRLHQWGVSLQTGRSLARLYETSLLATLLRMLQYGRGNGALVMWHIALKPTETRPTETKNRTGTPERKLRVWWRVQTQDWTGGFIPKDKSIAADSLITQAHLTAQPQTGMETLRLGAGAIECQVEAMPLQIGSKPCVLSLLKLLDA